MSNYGNYELEGLKHLCKVVGNNIKKDEGITEEVGADKAWSNKLANEILDNKDIELKTWIMEKGNSQMKVKVVAEEPLIEEMIPDVIYLIEQREKQEIDGVIVEVVNNYRQIMLVEGKKAELGDTKISLNDYYLKAEADEEIVGRTEVINEFTGNEGDTIINDEGQEVQIPIHEDLPVSQKVIWDLYTMLKADIEKGALPVGSIVFHYSLGDEEEEAIPPDYHLFCRGQELPIADYPELFEVIGYMYGGEGDVFRLPNLKSRIGVGMHTLTNSPLWLKFGQLNQTGGEIEIQLSESQMPKHKHTGSTYKTLRRTTGTFDGINYNNLSSETSYAAIGPYGTISRSTSTATAFSDSVHPGRSLQNTSGGTVDIRGVICHDSNSNCEIDYTGGNVNHNNCMPFIVLNVLIKYK